jgi:hypothetical protein
MTEGNAGWTGQEGCNGSTLGEGAGVAVGQFSVVDGCIALAAVEEALVFLSFARLSRLRPGRLVIRYSQVVPLLAQREQVGLSLEHLTFEEAQAWQLSRNLDKYAGAD